MRIVSVFLILFVFLGLGIGSSLYFLGYFDTPGPEVKFTVMKGENFAHLAAQLEAQKIVKSGRALRWYVNFTGTKTLKRGEFALHENMSVPEAVYALSEGKPIEYKVTIPEGINLFQVAEILEGQGLATKADFVKVAMSEDMIAQLPTVRAGDPKPTSIEGYIYPETYMLQKIFTPKEIAQIFVQKFRDVYKGLAKEIEMSETVRSLGLNPAQVITFASIVEKETGAGAERPIIASVFVNRLHKRMRLQTDPTVIYGVWARDGQWDGHIRKKDLETRTAYNSYTNDGLPPGPIASPGVNAIRAVLNPAATDFLYFVSKNDGTTIFSKDLKNHSRAVVETQLKPGARDGKSWRNLPKEQRAK